MTANRVLAPAMIILLLIGCFGVVPHPVAAQALSVPCPPVGLSGTSRKVLAHHQAASDACIAVLAKELQNVTTQNQALLKRVDDLQVSVQALSLPPVAQPEPWEKRKELWEKGYFFAAYCMPFLALLAGYLALRQLRVSMYNEIMNQWNGPEAKFSRRYINVECDKFKAANTNALEQDVKEYIAAHLADLRTNKKEEWQKAIHVLILMEHIGVLVRHGNVGASALMENIAEQVTLQTSLLSVYITNAVGRGQSVSKNRSAYKNVLYLAKICKRYV